MVRPGSYKNPTSSSLAPAEGMEFMSVIFMEVYGLESLICFTKRA